MRRALTLLLWTLSAPCAAAGWPEADWASLAAEAKTHLRALIRIDTSNPPGRESEAVRYLAGVLDEEGIPYAVHESSPGRASLVARLKGDGSRRPILISSHIDVVGVDRSRWSVDPFAAVEKDGYVYGRGAIDNKGLTAVELAVLVDLKRRGLPLSRDVILVAEADEESGGVHGMRWLVENRWKEVACEYAINEGGRVELEGGRVRALQIQSGEKLYHDLRVTARGPSGHSSKPGPDGAVFRLARALARLHASPPRPRATPLSRDPVADTVVPTLLSAGLRVNVIPAEAWANLNARLLPDTRLEDFLAWLRGVLGSEVEVAVSRLTEPLERPYMPDDNELFSAFRKAASRLAPGAPVSRSLGAGATDLQHLRRKGVLAYGIDLPMTAEDKSRMHGDDERLPEASLEWGARFLHATLAEVAGR